MDLGNGGSCGIVCPASADNFGGGVVGWVDVLFHTQDYIIIGVKIAQPLSPSVVRVYNWGMDFTQILYLYLLALTLAFLEVQIEGAEGWAAKLPCWRPAGRWYARVFTRVTGGKEMTGYHVGVFLFAFLMFHLPYVWGLPWSGGAEFGTLSAFFLFVVVWDFLWFVINPHYGIRKFYPGCVTWHKIWLGPAPVDYYGGLVLSFLFHALRVDAGEGIGFGAWFAGVGWFILLIGATITINVAARRWKHL